jgi:hypothetical protein
MIFYHTVYKKVKIIDRFKRTHTVNILFFFH